MAVTNITEEVSAMREHMKTCEKEVEICDLPVFCVTFGQNHVDPYFHKNMKNVWMKVYAPDIHMAEHKLKEVFGSQWASICPEDDFDSQYYTDGCYGFLKWSPPALPLGKAVDLVNHPPHYTSSNARCPECDRPIECIDVVAHTSFRIGNIIKYLWRANHKNGMEDLKKAKWYLDHLIEHGGD